MIVMIVCMYPVRSQRSDQNMTEYLRWTDSVVLSGVTCIVNIIVQI